MAVANTKSKIITNLDAAPLVTVDGRLMGGRQRSQVGTAAVLAADDDTSVYRFFRVRTNVHVNLLELWNDAITGGTVYNVGVLQTAENGGAAIDDNVFATTVTMAAARVAPLSVLFEALDIANIEKFLWEHLAFTEDPQIEVDIAITAATVGTAGGDISMRLGYTDGS